MNICVYCSSSNAIGDAYFAAARQLGELIGKKGHKLVNGGGNVGLMEAVTIAAKAAGGYSIGIIPERMEANNLTSSHLSQVEITADMMLRKERMRQLADAYIALPGGFGTLEEILEVITLKQLDYHRKAIVFININGFFNALFQQFEQSYKENFIKEAYRELYFIAETPEEAMKYIETYRQPEFVPKWFKVPVRKD